MTALSAVVLEGPVLRTPSAFAAHPDEFAPQIIPLDVSAESLSAFASEQVAAAQSRPPIEARSAPAPGRPIRLRVPRWIGTGSLAVFGGALSGLVIVAAFGPPVGATAGPSGAITITSVPPGAAVTVDDVARGVTPMTALMAAGPHRVRIGSGADARERQLHVSPGAESAIHVEWPVPSPPLGPDPAPAAANVPVAPTAALPRPPGAAVPARADAPGRAEAVAPTDRAESARPLVTSTTVFRPVPSGWLAISSPFPVQVYEDGVEVGRSASGRLLLPAGTHTLVLVNEALEVSQQREITIAARRTVSLALDAPTGVLHVNAQPWATVWVDGRRAGDTPIGNLVLPVGEHEVLLRHPQLGEERRTVVVGARTPARVGVEFRP